MCIKWRTMLPEEVETMNTTDDGRSIGEIVPERVDRESHLRNMTRHLGVGARIDLGQLGLSRRSSGACSDLSLGTYTGPHQA